MGIAAIVLAVGDIVRLGFLTSNMATLPQVPATTLLYNDWYPAMRSERLSGKKLETTMLMGIPMVLGRKDDGTLFAMRDSCPHRGIPLSCGWFDGKEVTCKYHGWAFEPGSGQCTLIPSLTSHDTLDARRIFATAFPCEERDGYAWVYVSEPGMGRARLEAIRPAVPELPKFGAKFRSAHLVADLPCNVDHGIIGLMDPAHGPFVHQAWWWRKRASIHEKEKHFEPIPEGFRMSAHAPSGNSAPYKLLGVYGEPITTTIDFVLPNRRFETIRCGPKWFSSLTTVTPTVANACRIDVYAAWNIFYAIPLVTTIAKFFGKRFVEQDRMTMVQQSEGLRYDPSLMLIDDADRPAKWYFALKQARLDGEPARHPMSGPVSLRWRS
ncbi:phenylpropionate dioxygenase-like ring-hydroxylating dioxygenase large terminal subunit [Silvibacterium bohemicum]|uniref:Phenylpropionate dioxygenase-like ring-hydroxylating dioxygenase large terminal subunit n=2 Tax=Silvibacterium bohemicum TaxID=1577686 RepID=A0A841JZ96_9BACT|nr:phenylpropionate dioxygenase-like ring-hydroxylating dioxygenase large terminal subunit [Silvibacterium bohemicum]